MKSIVVLSVEFKHFMLIIIMLNVVLLNDVMLNVIMSNVVMTSVVVADQTLKIKPKPLALF